MSGAERIAAERQRQIDVEGWTPAHDDQHLPYALLAAARCYANRTSEGWPWDVKWWKPKGHEQDLLRGGALAQAALDRLARRYGEDVPNALDDLLNEAVAIRDCCAVELDLMASDTGAAS